MDSILIRCPNGYKSSVLVMLVTLWILQLANTLRVDLNQTQHQLESPGVTAGEMSQLPAPVVHTETGPVRGVRRQSMSGIGIDAYLGIPFASSPTGDLRFSKPIPPEPWTEVRDASNFGNECIQNLPSYFPEHLLAGQAEQSEDCLHLNVYKPAITVDHGPLPVMVWVFGGAFVWGAGSQYDGAELADHGVIVVTFNYRVGVFGFLSNDDDTIPGNYGMLDQVMAFKWVQNNIREFGGDPNHVTIFGQSSGAVSVSLHLLSPLSAGLFSRAIMQSGASIAPWATSHLSRRITSRQKVSLIGQVVGCNQIDSEARLSCLRRIDAKTLFNASLNLGHTLKVGIIPNTPSVEKKFGFLPDYPAKLWEQNKFTDVDTIRGFNKAEMGMLYLRGYQDPKPMTKEAFVRDIKTFLMRYTVSNVDQFAEEMFEIYNTSEANSHENITIIIKALSELTFNGPILKEANFESKIASGKKRYMYMFDHKLELSPYPSWLPATHDEEIIPLFGLSQKQFKKDANPIYIEDMKLSDNIQKMWTNFAKYGDPSISNPQINWPAYDTEKQKALRIDTVSEEFSFKNHTAALTFSKLLERLDKAPQNLFILM